MLALLQVLLRLRLLLQVIQVVILQVQVLIAIPVENIPVIAHIPPLLRILEVQAQVPVNLKIQNAT